MDIARLQHWLNDHGADLHVDGIGGARTRAAIIAAFTNKQAAAVKSDEIATFSAEIGCTVKQLEAVAKVESAGGGFTSAGLPQILYERHYFWRLTSGHFDVAPWNNPTAGGYDQDSWTKLTMAACYLPDAALQSASWGKFQIMGAHWKALGYNSPIEMAHSFVRSETAHYDALTRFIRVNKLQAKLKALSTKAADCAPFAAAYNGPAYRSNAYDEKLARAMR